MKQLYRDKGKEIISEILKSPAKSERGSLAFLFNGEDKISTQSFCIRAGRNFEKWFKFIVEDSKFSLLPSGVIKNVVGSKSKDIDLIFKDEKTKTIYYRELKANIELDTEKLPATCEKIIKITNYLKGKYKEYKIDSGLFYWSVYEPTGIAPKLIRKVREFKSNGVKVSYPRDLFNLISVEIDANDYYSFFLELGDMA